MALAVAARGRSSDRRVGGLGEGDGAGRRGFVLVDGDGERGAGAAGDGGDAQRLERRDGPGINVDPGMLDRNSVRMRTVR